MSLKCSHTESSNCCILLYESIRSSRIVTYVHVSVLERCENLKQMNEGVVSKETVVLRRWGSSIQKFGFINGVDNVNWPPYRDSKS